MLYNLCNIQAHYTEYRYEHKHIYGSSLVHITQQCTNNLKRNLSFADIIFLKQWNLFIQNTSNFLYEQFLDVRSCVMKSEEFVHININPLRDVIVVYIPSNFRLNQANRFYCNWIFKFPLYPMALIFIITFTRKCCWFIIRIIIYFQSETIISVLFDYTATINRSL